MINEVEQVVAVPDDSVNQNLRFVFIGGHLGDVVEFFLQLLFPLFSQLRFSSEGSSSEGSGLDSRK